MSSRALYCGSPSHWMSSHNYVLLAGNIFALVPLYRGVFCSLSPCRSSLSTVATCIYRHALVIRETKSSPTTNLISLEDEPRN
jgi:hypothetical protein